MFKRCYYSCEYCISDGNKSHHNCISCNQDNRFSIPYDKDEIRNFNFTNLMGYSNYTIMNCYPSCMYNYLIDDDYNYTCLDEPGCPKRAPLLVNGTTKCVKSCKKIKNKYQFQNKCFLKCPPESIDFWNWGYYCKADCPRDKPFEMKELLARVRAMLRRRESYMPDILQWEDLALDKGSCELKCGGKSVRLTGKMFQLAELFLENPRILFSVQQLMDKVWGWDTEAEINVVWVNISQLRKKLAELETVTEIRVHRGTGYSLEKKTDGGEKK